VPVRPFIYAPPEEGPTIIEANDQFVIALKPSGLLTVPGRGDELQDCAIARLQSEYATATVVHRLDLDTSGVMVFALNKAAHRHLGLQFEKRRVKKTYIAIIAGHPVEKRGRISLPLICDWPNRPRQMVCTENGREAITDWRIIGREGENTRVALTPKTGRSHQLRVHLARMGHPILGDPFYAQDRDFEASERLLLHAQTLGFRHPDGGEPLEFNAPCPF